MMKRRAFLSAIGLAPLVPLAAKAAAALPASAPALRVNCSIASAAVSDLAEGTAYPGGLLAARAVTAEVITPGRITAEKLQVSNLTSVSPEFYDRLAADPGIPASKIAPPPDGRVWCNGRWAECRR